MRALGLLLALALLSAGCGKYGPPVRPAPTSPIEAPAEEERDERNTP